MAATSAGWNSPKAGRLGLHGGLGVEQRRNLVEVDKSVARSSSQRALACETYLVDHPVRRSSILVRTQRDVADGFVADLAVDQFATDQDFTGAGLERVEIDVPAAQPCPVAVEVGDAVGAHEDPAPLTVGDEARPPRGDRGLAALAGSTRDDHDVFDPADVGAAGIEQRQPHHPERIDQVSGHGRRLPRHTHPTVATIGVRYRSFTALRLERVCRCTPRRRPIR